MLEYLRIRDLALIENVELDFTKGMNVLTGETGAGKTFILKAIQFLLGEKLSADMVRAGSDKAQVEAVFYIGEAEYMLRRELIAETGRSRFFLNDSIASQETVKELRPSLILHVGQHGQQRLLQPSFQGKIIDSFLEDQSLIMQKEEAYKTLKTIVSSKSDLFCKIENLKERRELLELQQKEIEKVDPEDAEEEKLENLRTQYKSMDYIKNAYDEGFAILNGNGDTSLFDLLSQLERVLETLNKNQDFDHEMGTSYDALLTFKEEIKDLNARFRTIPQVNIELDMTLDEIEARLYELAQLKRKLNRTLPQILQLRDEIEENLSFLDACSLDIIRLEKEEIGAVKTLQNTLQKLNIEREKAARYFCNALQEELKGLGFSEKVAVIPEFVEHNLNKVNSHKDSTQKHLANKDTIINKKQNKNDLLEEHFDNLQENSSSCIEKTVRLLWAPNPGQVPQALDKIASGGELSRFLLAVIGLQEAQSEDATLIFDEVDAGIGGITLNRVAERLSSLAQKRQMLLITHWPQLAARAKNHFFISKEFTENETFSRCVRLSEKEKELELQRMAGEE